MKQQKIKIGEKVKIVPNSLAMISKSFLNYKENTQESLGESDCDVMLGGEYIVKDILRDGLVLKVLNDTKHEWKSLVDTKNVKCIVDIKYCPFSIGDTVKLSDDIGQTNHYIFTAIAEAGGVNPKGYFKIKNILNSYFIETVEIPNFWLFWDDFVVVN